MDAPDYTLRGMEGEIADYQNVIQKMRAELESMPDEQRHEVEQASKVLRRLRAGSASGRVSLPAPVVRQANEVVA
jgi:20S proteasome alpha/beta subunit